MASLETHPFITHGMCLYGGVPPPRQHALCNWRTSHKLSSWLIWCHFDSHIIWIVQLYHCDSFSFFSQVSQHISYANLNKLQIHHCSIWSIPIANVTCNYHICKSNIVINLHFFSIAHDMCVETCMSILRWNDMESITLIHESNDLDEELVKLISMRRRSWKTYKWHGHT